MTDREKAVIRTAVAFVDGSRGWQYDALKACVLALKVEQEAQGRLELLEFISQRSHDLTETSAQRLHRIKNAIREHEKAHADVLGSPGSTE